MARCPAPPPPRPSCSRPPASTAYCTWTPASAVAFYVPPERRVQKSPVAAAMRERLDIEEGRAVYAQRKAVVEPVFGQVKEIRGFRRFSLRGRELVSEEWQLICLTHNLLKLFRAGAQLVPA